MHSWFLIETLGLSLEQQIFLWNPWPSIYLNIYPLFLSSIIAFPIFYCSFTKRSNILTSSFCTSSYASSNESFSFFLFWGINKLYHLITHIIEHFSAADIFSQMTARWYFILLFSFHDLLIHKKGIRKLFPLIIITYKKITKQDQSLSKHCHLSNWMVVYCKFLVPIQSKINNINFKVTSLIYVAV